MREKHQSGGANLLAYIAGIICLGYGTAGIVLWGFFDWFLVRTVKFFDIIIQYIKL